MKIVTVNVPSEFIQAMEKLTGNNGLYPSRSELIRCAVRDFLIKELKMARKLSNFDKKEKESMKVEDKSIVQIPLDENSNDDKTERNFKTYKIIKRLEF